MRASQIAVDVEDADSADARWCLEQYYSTLAGRFEDGYDRSRHLSASAEEMSPSRGVFLVARLHGEPVGCGGLKATRTRRLTSSACGSRRSFAVSASGAGSCASSSPMPARRGAGSVRLETYRSLTEAIALYRSFGYVEVPAFSDEPHAHLWFEKQLVRAAA